MVDIYQRTACLTVIFEDNKIEERRVADHKEDNYENQTQPELTLDEELQIAFHNATVTKDTLIYKNIKFNLQGNTDLILDQRTLELIKLQTKKNKLQSIFDTKLIQGMKIIFKENNETETVLKEHFNKIHTIIKQKINKLSSFYLLNNNISMSEVSLHIKKVIKEDNSNIPDKFIDEIKN